MNRLIEPTSREKSQRNRELRLYRLAARPSRETAAALYAQLVAEDPVHWDSYSNTCCCLRAKRLYKC